MRSSKRFHAGRQASVVALVLVAAVVAVLMRNSGEAQADAPPASLSTRLAAAGYDLVPPTQQQRDELQDGGVSQQEALQVADDFGSTSGADLYLGLWTDRNQHTGGVSSPLAYSNILVYAVVLHGSPVVPHGPAPLPGERPSPRNVVYTDQVVFVNASTGAFLGSTTL